jgi:hypothetical protein
MLAPSAGSVWGREPYPPVQPQTRRDASTFPPGPAKLRSLVTGESFDTVAWEQGDVSDGNVQTLSVLWIFTMHVSSGSPTRRGLRLHPAKHLERDGRVLADLRKR